MIPLPLCSAKEIIRLLEQMEFKLIRSKGSHRIYRHADGRSTVVPVHGSKDIPRPLIYEILKQAGISQEEYLRLRG